MALQNWETEVAVVVSGEGTSKRTQSQVSALALGDGYVQRVPVGINSTPRIWDLSKTVNQTEEGTIDTFLRGKRGVTPFTWTPPGADSGGTVQVICQEWDFGYLKGVNSRFTATFQEDFTIQEGDVTAPVEVPDLISLAIVSTTEITITWTDIADDQAYVVERSTDGISYSEINTTANNVTTYADSGLSPAQIYYYRVKAAGGTYSNVLSGTPGGTAVTVPQITSINMVSSTEITITWSDLAGDQAYQVERSTDGISYSVINTTANNVTTYADTGLTASTQYYYRVAVAP